MTENPRTIKLDVLSHVESSDDAIVHKTPTANPREAGASTGAPDGEDPVMIFDSDEGRSSEDTVRNGPQQGFREGLRIIRGDDKRSYDGDINEQGMIIESMAGPALSTDEGELQAAHVLIWRINQDGENWGPPKKVTGAEEGVDCEAQDLDIETFKLEIQITMPPENAVLHRLGQGFKVQRQQEPADAVDLLQQAIAKKHAKDLKHRQKRGGRKVVLAVDATDRAGFAFQTVVNSFRDEYGAWAGGLGFEAVWLVGPTTSTTYRLDV